MVKMSNEKALLAVIAEGSNTAKAISASIVKSYKNKHML